MDLLEAGARRLDEVERAERWDQPVSAVRGVLDRFLPRPVKDALHGRWLGHPLHPALTDVPIGAWLGATALDRIPGQERAATALVGLGLAGAVPAAASGAVDWAEASREQERLGIWHWLANLAGTGLYAASLVARLRGRHRGGRALGLAGLAVVGVGAYLGGHLAYRSGTGFNHAMAAWRRLPRGWYPIGELAELPLGQPVRRYIGDVPVLVYRGPRTVRVLVDQCVHLAGPLADGEITVVGDDACVVCPWHGSTYRLRDGAVRRGPATMPQPILKVRIVDDRVEACRPT
jgi:nitrite reductase/ring-hydroxylating ferredoxin subunit